MVLVSRDWWRKVQVMVVREASDPREEVMGTGRSIRGAVTRGEDLGSDLVSPTAAAITSASPRASATKSEDPLRKCSSNTATPITRLTIGSTVIIAGRLELSGPAR